MDSETGGSLSTRPGSKQPSARPGGSIPCCRDKVAETETPLCPAPKAGAGGSQDQQRWRRKGQ